MLSRYLRIGFTKSNEIMRNMSREKDRRNRR